MLELEPTTTNAVHSSSIQKGRWDKVKVNALLIFVTMIWGSTFLVVQRTIQLTGPFTFLALRFGIAVLVLAVLFHKHLARLTSAELVTGSIIGLFLFGTYALQTVGLQYTTSSKAGFITGLYVPLVALLAVPMLRQKPTAGGVLGVFLSLLGLTLISVNKSFQLTFGLGEWLVLGCAFCSALHVIFVSKFSPRVDAINLAIVQIALTALLSLIAIPIAREPVIMPPLPVWISALFMGVFATALALTVMNRVQQFVSSTNATLIYSLEIVWAGLFGYLAGDQLSTFAWIGCACIFLGMIMGEWRFSFVGTRFLASVFAHRPAWGQDGREKSGPYDKNKL